MPSHYGKHTRSEYLRHNPTDWRERAMGSALRRKKKNEKKVQNVTTSRDDVAKTTGAGATGTQGGPATRRNYPPKTTPPNQKQKNQQKVVPHKPNTKKVERRIEKDNVNKKKTTLSNKKTEKKVTKFKYQGNVLNRIVQQNMKAFPDAYKGTNVTTSVDKKKKRGWSMTKMLKSLLTGGPDYRSGNVLKNISNQK